MIVPMKKVSLVIMGDKKQETLRKLRKLGIIHIEISEGSGERLDGLKEQIALLESAVFVIGKSKKAVAKELTVSDSLAAAKEIASLDNEKKDCQAELVALKTELDRLKSWGDVDPAKISALAEKGVEILLYEMPKTDYESLGENVKTVRLDTGKASVKFLIIRSGIEGEDEVIESLTGFKLMLPQISTSEINRRIAELNTRVKEIDEAIASYSDCVTSMKNAVKAIEKEIEFEVYAPGMADELLSSDDKKDVSVAYFTGYIEAENLDGLKQTAKNNSWGLLVEEPCEEDNVPTKLKNNKFVSLIYPLTDFLGTVPGYFEYDISAWFLGFILIFFGIIFGDGGYGLLICAAAAIPIV